MCVVECVEGDKKNVDKILISFFVKRAYVDRRCTRVDVSVVDVYDKPPTRWRHENSSLVVSVRKEHKDCLFDFLYEIYFVCTRFLKI